MLTLRRDRLEWWNSDESVFWSGTLKRVIQTKWIVQVSLCCKYRLWPLFANTGTWTVCPWALFFFLLSLFWNLYQWGRATAGGGRDCNLERISHSLIFCLHLWGFETKAPLGFFDCDLFQICTAPKMQWHTVSLFYSHTTDCFASLWVKVCGTCRISRMRPLPNICASRINSVQPDAL